MRAIIFFLVLGLFGCGKIPESVGLPSEPKAEDKKEEKIAEKVEKKSEEKVEDDVGDEVEDEIETPLPRTKNVCEASTTFLDSASIRFEVKENVDGSTEVKCAVKDTLGVTEETVVNYGADIGAERIFSLCRIYYKNAHNLTFILNGNYNAGMAVLFPIETGFYITGTGTLPADEDSFLKTTCREEEVL